jgi:hypothetical protein
MALWLLAMKTTVDLPDRLLIAAKQLAAEERRPLKDVMAEGLRRVLEQSAPAHVREPRFRWVTAKGGVPPETADREAMQSWMSRDA